MGKEIESLAIEKKIQITNIFDIDTPLSIDAQYDFDVAIDFSVADSVLSNVKILSQLKKNIVIGTTAWYGDVKQIEQICVTQKIGCIWSSNFSIGMQIFFRTLEKTAKLVNNFDLYDVFISDIHHKNKLDSPSGTAKQLAKIIVDNTDNKNTILTEAINRKILSNELHISSLRGGSICGTHTVFFDSEADTVELTHRAKSRRGFAEGALLAANWINNKIGFYHFDDILFEHFI
jgi:4-hydroxy-tetrahydrodipicolinate reductase